MSWRCCVARYRTYRKAQHVIEKIFDQKELSFTNPRCLYENEDILVRHQIMTFADGSKEAVMVVQLKKDGKIIKSETGATPLK